MHGPKNKILIYCTEVITHLYNECSKIEKFNGIVCEFGRRCWESHRNVWSKLSCTQWWCRCYI